MSSFFERCLPLWEGHQTEEAFICDQVLTKGKKAVVAIVQDEHSATAADLTFKVANYTIGHLYGYDILERLNVRGLKKPADLLKNDTAKALVESCADRHLKEARIAPPVDASADLSSREITGTDPA